MSYVIHEFHTENIRDKELESEDQYNFLLIMFPSYSGEITQQQQQQQKVIIN